MKSQMSKGKKGKTMKKKPRTKSHTTHRSNSPCGQVIDLLLAYSGPGRAQLSLALNPRVAVVVDSTPHLPSRHSIRFPFDRAGVGSIFFGRISPTFLYPFPLVTIPQDTKLSSIAPFLTPRLPPHLRNQMGCHSQGLSTLRS